MFASLEEAEVREYPNSQLLRTTWSGGDSPKKRGFSYEEVCTK